MKFTLVFQFLTVTLIAMLLVACGGGGGGGGSTTPPPSASYTVGGTVSGLTGTGLVLRNNGGDSLSIVADGIFTFTNTVANGDAYDVTVSDHPTHQTCSVSNGSSVVAQADVTDVAVACKINVTQLATGSAHSCGLLANGNIKCWGGNYIGQLGAGDTNNRGSASGEMGDLLPAVDLGSGHTAIQVAVNGQSRHTCALLDDGNVKCWGANDNGQLGLGDTTARGRTPGEMGDSLPTVELGTGRTATYIAVSSYHTCALLDDGTVKCWGLNANGQLGQGDANPRGGAPGEMGDALPAVDLGTGRTAVQIAVGNYHNCALLSDGGVKCWGRNTERQLGSGDGSHRGTAPGQMGDALPTVNLGTGRTATQVAAGRFHACALLDNGQVKCWGDNANGQLGLGDMTSRGGAPGEMGDALPAVDLGTGRAAIQMAAGAYHTCALLDDGNVKCWGLNANGQLGLGDMTPRGGAPGEMGDALPTIDLGTGSTAIQIVAGANHTCARLSSSNSDFKCWGGNNFGQLGLGDSDDRGDAADEMGDGLPLVDVGTR